MADLEEKTTTTIGSLDELLDFTKEMDTKVGELDIDKNIEKMEEEKEEVIKDDIKKEVKVDKNVKSKVEENEDEEIEDEEEKKEESKTSKGKSEPKYEIDEKELWKLNASVLLDKGIIEKADDIEDEDGFVDAIKKDYAEPYRISYVESLPKYIRELIDAHEKGIDISKFKNIVEKEIEYNKVKKEDVENNIELQKKIIVDRLKAKGEEEVDVNREIELIIGIIEQINEMIITCLERLKYTENELIEMSLVKLKTIYGYTLDHKMFEMEFNAGCHGVDITEKKETVTAADIEKANELLKGVNNAKS